MRRQKPARTGLTARSAALGPLRELDAVSMWSFPARLALGHPLRASRCLLCGTMIGGQDCRIITVIVLDRPDCECGQIPNVCQLICTDHGEPTSLQLVEAAARYADKVHPPDGVACRG